MNRLPASTVIALRELVREAMRAQRAVIARQLGPEPGHEPVPSFPRSRTMRLVTRHPMLVGGVLSRIAPLFIGATLARKLIGPIAIVLSVAGATRTLMNRR